jgi:hypothetical protein
MSFFDLAVNIGRRARQQLDDQIGVSAIFFPNHPRSARAALCSFNQEEVRPSKLPRLQLFAAEIDRQIRADEEILPFPPEPFERGNEKRELCVMERAFHFRLIALNP